MLERFGVGYRVRIYVAETDTTYHRPVHLRILSLLQREDCAGVTVVRGVEGFGAHGRIHSANLVEVRTQLPLIIEWVDTPERVERVLPQVAAQVEGLITAEAVRIVKYPERAVRSIPESALVSDVMTPNDLTHTVMLDTPIRAVVTLLMQQRRNALPVLDDDGRVAGIITNQDLVERAGLPLRLELLRELGEPESESVQGLLASIERDGQSAAAIMSTPVVTTSRDTPLTTAARIMLARRLKRLPVVDRDNRLVGIVSRFDVLRTVSDAYTSETDKLEPVSSQGATQVREIMNTDVPAIGPEATLPEVLDAVMATRLHRAVVIDEDREPIGMVVDSDLVRRVTPEEETGVFAALMHRLSPTGIAEQHSRDPSRLRAADVMRSRQHMLVVSADAPIFDVAEQALNRAIKLVVIIDRNHRLLGMVDRADLLAALT